MKGALHPQRKRVGTQKSTSHHQMHTNSLCHCQIVPQTNFRDRNSVPSVNQGFLKQRAVVKTPMLLSVSPDTHPVLLGAQRVLQTWS